MVIIGIDPGKTGAIAMISEDGNYCIVDTPILKIDTGKKTKSGNPKINTEYLVSEMVKELSLFKFEHEETHVFIEKVHAMPDQGVTSMFDMGYGLGAWHGIITALGFPLHEITPQAWKKSMMSGMGKEKDASVYKAQQIFPKAKLLGPKGAKLHGRADALLIAEYGKRMLNNASVSVLF